MGAVFGKPNPYGAVTKVDLSAFEKQICLTLPSEYREYLLEYNGAVPERNFFRTEKNPDDYLELKDLNVLDGGPDYLSLNTGWSLPDSYDLPHYRDDLLQYIVVGSSYGCAVIIDADTGQVLFYDPDHDEPKDVQELKQNLVLLSASFGSFIDSMVSKEEAGHD